MAWKDSKGAYRSRWRTESEPEYHFPSWAWQTLAAVFIFCILLGASRSNTGMALEAVAVARDAVNTDTTYQDVKTWIAKLPDTVAAISRFDLRGFWAERVTGRQSALLWPCDGEVTSYFGWRANDEATGMSLHQGIDIDSPEGGKVVAVLDGIITGIRQSPSYGLVVEIEHSQGFSSVYGHLSSASVVKDQKVKKGEAIGTVGESGNATGPHLHFEIRKDGIEIDPMTLLPPKAKMQ